MTGRHPVPQTLAAAVAIAVVAVATVLAAPAEAADPSERIEGVLISVAHALGDDAFAEEGHASDQDLIVTDDGALIPVELPVGVEVEAGSHVETVAAAGSAELIASLTQDAADPAGEPSVEAHEEVQLESVQVVAQAPVARDGASHRAFVVTVDDDTTGTDVPVAEAVDATEMALDYWVDETDGAIGDFTVADSRTLTPGSQCPSYLSLWNQALGLYPHVDFFGGTDHLIVYTPGDCDYEYAGIASVGGRLDGGVVHVASNEHHTIVHELGHNLSLMHSNLRYLEDGAWKAHEYFGLFGPMSGSVSPDFAPGAVGASQRYFLGLPGAREGTEHMLIEMGMGDTRTVTLSPVYADSGTTAVRLLDAATGETFFVEYRAGAGKDADTFYQFASTISGIRFDGGLVRYGPGVVVSQHSDDGAVSVLTSLSGTGRWDAVQREGTTLVDEFDRFSITGGAATSEAVEVTITTGGPNPSPFGAEIAWLRDNGITSNWADGTFRPRGHVTRDAMVTFLYRLSGEPAVTLPRRSPFSDVTPDNTEFYKEIVWAHQQGISSGWARGGGFEFRPESRITRDAMAAFLYRYAGATETATGADSFKDVSRRSSEFYDEIAWMASAGISTGWKDGTFRPLDHVTREAMAAFLFRLAA
ncbi:S-layer homology domain-containing protein [Demequina sp. SO4-18]|uniref:S-layer homology domain-containing protein n=1 Tax=Demequina sp. SO4-18 TaxID=3401026 RepID=UPI003B58CAB0